MGQLLRAMRSNGCRVTAAVRSSAASAAAAAPTRPVVLAKPLVVALAAPADKYGLELSRDVLVGVVWEVLLNKKINQEATNLAFHVALQLCLREGPPKTSARPRRTPQGLPSGCAAAETRALSLRRPARREKAIMLSAVADHEKHLRRLPTSPQAPASTPIRLRYRRAPALRKRAPQAHDPPRRRRKPHKKHYHPASHARARPLPP